MKVAIITGVSQGLGEATANLFLQREIPVIGVSRTKNNNLTDLALKHQTTYTHFAGDLTKPRNVEQVIEKVTNKLSEWNPSTIYFINNAAVVEPVHQVTKLNNEELMNHIQLNYTAPMLMTNAILDAANQYHASMIGVAITSGAAESPIYGWSAYCSTKAGLNMYMKTVALEQEQLASGHKMIAFNPGIMDTNMQSKIRHHTNEAFIDVDRFKAYKNEQMLQNPDDVAHVLFRILEGEKAVKNGHIYDVNTHI